MTLSLDSKQGGQRRSCKNVCKRCKGNSVSESDRAYYKALWLKHMKAEALTIQEINDYYNLSQELLNESIDTRIKEYVLKKFEWGA